MQDLPLLIEIGATVSDSYNPNINVTIDNYKMNDFNTYLYKIQKIKEEEKLEREEEDKD